MNTESFYFKLRIDNVNASDTISFEEVSEGTNKEKKTSSNLVLKKGTSEAGTELSNWIIETINSALTKKITPKDIRLSLSDANSNLLKDWAYINAYPVKCILAVHLSTDGRLIIECVEFVYEKTTV